MEKYVACLMTTDWFEKDNRNIRFSEETLEDQQKQINEEAHIPFGFDHNPILMPIGRTDSAWLERTNGTISLMVNFFVHLDVDAQPHPKSGTKIANLQLGKSSRGFVSNRQDGTDDGVVISVDPSDFENSESWDAFVRKMTSDDRTVRVREYARNAVDPDGLILITLGAWAVLRLEKFARHVIDETLRKVGDRVSDKLSTLILDTMGVFEQTAAKKIEKYHVVMIFPGRPELVLVSERQVGKLSDVVDELESTEIGDVLATYGDMFAEAQEITLIREHKSGWAFQHIKTVDGNIIGDWECYQVSIRRWAQSKELRGGIPVSPAGRPGE